MPEANVLRLPNGSHNSMLALITWVLSKSETVRSSRKFRMSVGVRLLVVLRPPLLEDPVGSTDMSSIDLLNVLERRKGKPCAKPGRAATNNAWYTDPPWASWKKKSENCGSGRK